MLSALKSGVGGPPGPPFQKRLLDSVVTWPPGHAAGGHPGTTSNHAAGMALCSSLHQVAGLSMDFICLTAFNQPCCRQKGKSSVSSFSFFGILPEEKVRGRASSLAWLAQCWWRPCDQEKEKHSERFPDCKTWTRLTFQHCRAL